jgi:hypothetical protein
MEQNSVVAEKSNFIWEQMKTTLEKLNSKKISTEDAKATANLLKQANNILVFQLDAAKFITHPERQDTLNAMKNVGF